MSDRPDRGRKAAINGFAHEHIALGMLMKRYQNASLVDLPLSPYDIVIVLKREDDTEDIIRAQVKTARKGVSFVSGSRGGVDRQYISDVKTYTQSIATSDVVIGICPLGEDKYELYFVPTVLIEELGQKSVSLRRIAALRNKWEILEKCKDRDFVLGACKAYGILAGGTSAPLGLEGEEDEE